MQAAPLPSAKELSQEQQSLSAEARALAAVAHELRNPLQTLGNLLYLAANEASIQAVREHLASAQHEVTALRTIVTNMLGALRERSPEEETNLPDILDASLRTFADKILYKRITVDKRVEFTDVIRASPVELRMIVDNLLGNALEAIPMEGKITLRVAKSRDWKDNRPGFRIVISDNGPGIPPEYRKRIFEPFFTTKSEKGTGIGLWVVQRTLRKHSGSIHFRTRIQREKSGTVFSIFLPVAEKPEAPPAPRSAQCGSAA